MVVISAGHFTGHQDDQVLQAEQQQPNFLGVDQPVNPEGKIDMLYVN